MRLREGERRAPPVDPGRHRRRARPREVEEAIWDRMHFASHLRSERLGEFTIATELHRSESLAIVQLLVLYHLVTARASVALGGAGSRVDREPARRPRSASALEQHPHERAGEGDLPEGRRRAEVGRAEQRRDRGDDDEDARAGRRSRGSRAGRLTFEGGDERGHVGARVAARPATRSAARRPPRARRPRSPCSATKSASALARRARQAPRRRGRGRARCASSARDELVDAAARGGDRGDRDDRGVARRRASAAPRAGRAARAAATSPRSALVTTSTSGISMIPAFRNCSTSPEPGWTTTATVSATSATSVSRLADADGLDHDDVEGGGQRLRGRARGGREAAEALAGGGRADEDAAVGGVEGDPRAVAEQRRRPSAASDGSTASTATLRPSRPPGAHELATAASTCRRPGGPVTPTTCAGRLAAERGRGDLAQQRRRPARAPRRAVSTRLSTAGAARQVAARAGARRARRRHGAPRSRRRRRRRRRGARPRARRCRA